MTKLIRQEDLHPDGFKCVGGKITPSFTSPAFACSQLGVCSIGSLSDVDTSSLVLGRTLIWDGTQFVAGNADGNTVLDIEQVAHGFTLPTEGVIPVYHDGTGWALANTTDLDQTHEAFIIDVPDDNTLKVQQTGFVTTASTHGLTVGGKYYVQDDGSLSTTTDADISDIAVIPVDTDVLMLLDNYAFTVPDPVSHETIESFTGLSSGNTVTIAGTYDVARLIKVYRNGLLQVEGAGNEYEISGQTVTFATAFSGSEAVQVIYYA